VEAQQQEEWYTLERQATEQLRRGNTPKRSGVSQLFQLLVLPSFEAASSWEVCREVCQDVKATDRYFAVHSVWDKLADLSKLQTPVVRLRHPSPLVPTIEVRQLPLDADWVEATQNDLSSLVIPAMVKPEVIGVDGTSYEVAFNALFVLARYRWWEEPPSGWRPLNEWLHQTLETLERLAVRE
jgi:hypothetical protein